MRKKLPGCAFEELEHEFFLSPWIRCMYNVLRLYTQMQEKNFKSLKGCQGFFKMAKFKKSYMYS